MDTGRLAALLSPESPLLVATEVTGSTNSDARSYVTEHRPSSPVLFVSDRQTAGRGRQGKSFLSPEGGLYMTLALRTDRPAAELIGSTACAAVAVTRAIRSVTGAPCGIKWVNDIYLEGGKLCGILVESVNSGTVSDYLLIGVGVNLTESPVITDSPVSSASLRNYSCHREELCAAIVRELYVHARSGFDFSLCSDEYRSYSVILGRSVTFSENGCVRSGTAMKIEDDGALTVMLPDGSSVRLRSGEITVRVDSRDIGNGGNVS